MNFDLIQAADLGAVPGEEELGNSVVDKSVASDRASTAQSTHSKHSALEISSVISTSSSSLDSLATGWKLKSKRRRRNKLETKHMFPWVADQWIDLEDEQKRQRKRQGRLVPNANSGLYSTLKSICTLYGPQPGTYCSICKVVHKKPREVIDKETLEDTSGWVSATLRADIKRQRKLRTNHLKKLQISRMAHAADALKWRRRRREKKMKLPKGTLLNDYTDAGGGDVDPDMRKAVDVSMKNQGLSKRDKRFRGKLSRRLPMLRFPKVGIRIDEEEGGDAKTLPSKRKRRKRPQLPRIKGIDTTMSFKYDL